MAALLVLCLGLFAMMRVFNSSTAFGMYVLEPGPHLVACDVASFAQDGRQQEAENCRRTGYASPGFSMYSLVRNTQQATASRATVASTNPTPDWRTVGSVPDSSNDDICSASSPPSCV